MNNDVGVYMMPLLMCRCSATVVMVRNLQLNPPRAVVRCMSQGCPEFDREKEVTFPHIPGRYLLDANN